MVSSYFFRLSLLLAAKEFLDDVERHRDEENSDQRRGSRASHDRGTHDLPRYRARTMGEGKREHTEKECKGCHEDRPETQPGSLKGGIGQGSSLFMSRLCELDDQDRVLCGKADEHDEADLGIYVVVHQAVCLVAQPYAGERAKNRNGGTEKHAERQGPALVLGCKDEKNAEERKSEDG